MPSQWAALRPALTDALGKLKRVLERADEGMGLRFVRVGNVLLHLARYLERFPPLAGEALRIHESIAEWDPDARSDDAVQRAVVETVLALIEALLSEDSAATGCAPAGRTRHDDGKENESANEDQPSLDARALAMLTDHPDWTDVRIAAALGCNRTSLYRLPRFTAARELLKQQGRREMPRGVKPKAGNLDAWRESDGDSPAGD